MGVLPTALRRNVGNRTLEDLQKRLLHTFAADVPGDGGIFGLPGDLVDLINVDDTPLRRLHVVIGGLDQTHQDIFHIVAHIARFRQGSGIGNGKGDVQDLGQRLSQHGLAHAGGP